MEKERRVFPTQRKQVSSDKWQHIGPDGRKYIITKVHGASHEHIPAWYQLKIWDIDQGDYEYINILPEHPQYKELEQYCNSNESKITVEHEVVDNIDAQIAIAEEQEELADEDSLSCITSSSVTKEEMILVLDDLQKEINKLNPNNSIWYKIKTKISLYWYTATRITPVIIWYWFKYIVTFKWIKGE